jgi:GLPGLI family protein
MMMTKFLRLTFFIILPFQLLAQEKFVYSGTITYERKINVYRQTDGIGDESWIKTILPTLPNFYTNNFVMKFNNDESIYQPEGELPAINLPYLIGPAKENVIITNFKTHTQTGYKTVFEKNFQVQDSLGYTAWRITDEKRTIAGMECRKAVTIICDSVYVVAFYAEEIPVSGGPESFKGLPGMILGLAIPRLHTTWFATGIVLKDPVANDFVVKKKGQKTNSEKLFAEVKSSLKEWTNFGERNIWWILL